MKHELRPSHGPGFSGKGHSSSFPHGTFSLRGLMKRVKKLPFDSGQIASAYVMTQFFEEKMLSAEDFRKMAEAGDASEALGQISTSSLYGQLENASPEDYEGAVEREVLALFEFLKAFSPDRELGDIVRLDYDFHALKLLIKLKKGWLAEEELETMTHPLGFLTKERILELVKRESFEDIWKELGSYAPTLEQLSALEKIDSPYLGEQMVDTLIDHQMLAESLQIGQNLRSKLLKEITRLMIDFGNLRLFVRAQALGRGPGEICPLFLAGGRIERGDVVRLYPETVAKEREEKRGEIVKFLEELMRISYKHFFPIGNISQETKLETGIAKGFDELGSTGSLFSLEKLFDNLIMWKAKEGRTRHFTLDPIISYVFGKLGEIKNFRIVMTGKINKLEPERIISLLRDSYRD